MRTLASLLPRARLTPTYVPAKGSGLWRLLHPSFGMFWSNEEGARWATKKSTVRSPISKKMNDFRLVAKIRDWRRRTWWSHRHLSHRQAKKQTTWNDGRLGNTYVSWAAIVWFEWACMCSSRDARSPMGLKKYVYVREYWSVFFFIYLGKQCVTFQS